MTTPPPQGNPFAQGQPAGQPQQAPYPPQGGYPQQPGQPGFPPQGAAPYVPVPPQPTGRKLSFKTIKNIAIVIAVAGIAIGGYITSRDDAKTAAVGDCMHRGSTNDNNPDLEVVECSDAKAQYVVLAKIEGAYLTQTLASSKCEAEAKDFQYTYTESGDSKDFLLCLKDKK
ncbi:LppU/SCO3897 family protein [Streptomyces sp. URMC 128]|uniref:LppU/SCO3897 family protein n=1 Tax=Streptomyces sp. URMC 128 TaxID=3423404 RepID=UPI003F1D1482